MTPMMKKTICAISAGVMMMTALVAPTEKQTDMGISITANAENLTGDYYKYYSNMEMSKGIFPGYDIVSSYVSATGRNQFNYCTEVAREKYGVPHGMNCTLVCITNLVIHYRKANGMPTPSSCYESIYKDIESYAKKNCGFSLEKGMSVFYNKGLLKAAMERWGFKNVNVNTFSNADSLFLSSTLMRNCPYILSSTTQNHSLVIYGSETLETVGRDPMNNLKYGSVDPKLYAYDPSGEKFFLNGTDIVSATAIDCEQVMYVKSYERDPKGDVNGDTYVNILDLATLKQYIMMDPVYINEKNSNLNGDNYVDLTDLTYLAFYLLDGEWK